jgi:hypothetical protein
MVRSSDVMRLLDNCSRIKISAVLLDSHMCLIKKLTSILTHFRGAPDHRVRARELLDEMHSFDPASYNYLQVRA